MAARRKRATVQRAVAPRTSKLKAAGLRAHNRRLGSAISSRNAPSFAPYSKARSMGLAEAKMTRLRRKVRAVNPRLAARRATGLGVMAHMPKSHVGSRRFTADPRKLGRRPSRMYKRDSRGRFARR